ALLEDLAIYDNKSWNDPRDFAKSVKAISLPPGVPSTSDRRLIELENQVQRLMEAHLALNSPVQVNKIASSCEICSGEQNKNSSSPKRVHFINIITIINKENEHGETWIIKPDTKDNDHDIIFKVEKDDFMIVEDISSIIDPMMSQVVLGKPFVEIFNMTYDLSLGVVRFMNRINEIAYKMPHKIEQFNSLSDLEKEHTKSVYFRNEEDKRRGESLFFWNISINITSSSSPLVQTSSALDDWGTNPSDSKNELSLRTFWVMNETNGSGGVERLTWIFFGLSFSSFPFSPVLSSWESLCCVVWIVTALIEPWTWVEHCGYYVVPYGELNDIPVASMARFGVISKSTDRILVSPRG
nr:retrotransposon Orf1 [Tanacetum cinerariifolium]